MYFGWGNVNVLPQKVCIFYAFYRPIIDCTLNKCNAIPFLCILFNFYSNDAHQSEPLSDIFCTLIGTGVNRPVSIIKQSSIFSHSCYIWGKIFTKLILRTFSLHNMKMKGVEIRWKNLSHSGPFSTKITKYWIYILRYWTYILRDIGLEYEKKMFGVCLVCFG